MSKVPELRLNVMTAAYSEEAEEPLDADRDYSVQPHLRRRAVVHLFCRDAEGKRQVIRDWRGTFKPYFYAPTRVDNKQKIVDFLGRNVKRVEVDLPRDVPNARSLHPFTDEAAILFEKRFQIDKRIRCGMKVILSTPAILEPAEPLDIQPRIHFYDVEVAAEGDIDVKNAPHPVTIISCFDTYNEEFHAFLHRPPNVKKREIVAIIERIEKVWKEEYGFTVKVHLCPNEFQTINMWAQYVAETDPDALVAHNGDKFDFPYLYNRCFRKYWKNIFRKLSPMNSAHMKGKYPYIKGREHIDFCGAKAKRDGMYTNFTVQDTDVDSLRLEELAEVELEYKYRFGKIGGEIDALWHSKDARDTFKMIFYNLEDVYIMVMIDRKRDMVARYEGVRQIFGCTLKDTLSNEAFIDMGCLRETTAPLPTKLRKEKEKKKSKKKQIEGAIVIRPAVGMFGVMKDG